MSELEIIDILRHDIYGNVSGCDNMEHLDNVEHLEFPAEGDFLECKECKVRIVFAESTFRERRKRLIDFIEVHLHSTR
jgi:hypothetical protein